MAEKPIEAVTDDTESDADFDAGFQPATQDALSLEDDAKKDEVTPPPENKDDPPTPAPEYVQLTKEQLARLEAAADKNGEFEKRFSTIFGTLGGVQELVKKMQSETPKGDAVAIPDDAFAEMAEDYPDMARHLRGVLEKTLKGVRGTGAAASSIEPEELSKLVSPLVAEGVKQAQIETLQDVYPDWREIVGAVDRAKGEEPDPNNEFRKWLGTQPADYAAKVTSSHSAIVLSNAIAKFKEDTKTPPKAPLPPPPKNAARKARVEAAIVPKGDGNPPPPPTTGDDEFDAGYAERNKHRSG